MLYIFSLIQLLNSQVLPPVGATIGPPVETWPRIGVVTLDARLEHVQGIDVDDTHLWVSSVDRAAKKGWLRRFELRTGRLLNAVEVTAGERYHPGGIALDGSSIWVPVAEYKASSSTTVQRRDKTTLRELGSFLVDDHIGCIALAGKELVGGNWDSVTLYRWRGRGSGAGQELGRMANPTGVAFQDLKALRDGRLLGGGIRAKRVGEVVVFSLGATGGKGGKGGIAPPKAWPAGRTDRGVHYTNEGIALRKGRLYLLPEDGESRLFIFSAAGQID